MNRFPRSQFPSSSGSAFGPKPAQHGIGPSQDALPAGTRLAEYELLSVLSEGRFGAVYLALDHGLQRQVVIKEYLPAALASRGRGAEVTLRSAGHAETYSAGLKSFVSEARLLARFDHAALARVYRFWEANRTAYIAMPYYEGGTLRVAREAMAHPPDEAWLRDLLLPLLGALDVLHAASCYPRQISPENILLLPDGRPLLLHFGAARHVVGDRSQTLTAVLEPAFAPIEQYGESTQLRQGPWSNLYALAAVAYYCVGGYPPVPSTVRALDDQMEPLFEVVDRVTRSFPNVHYSVAFVAAIERALSVRPQERPQSVGEFRRALLGGRGTAQSIGVPPPVDDTEQQGAARPRPPPSPSLREETEALAVGRKAPGGRNFDDAPPQRAELSAPDAASRPHDAPWREGQADFGTPAAHASRESVDEADDAAWWAALEAALGTRPPESGESPEPAREAKPAGPRRALFSAVAVVALVVLGAGGWMLWSDFRDTDGPVPPIVRDVEPGGLPAPRVRPEPPVSVLPAPRPDVPPSPQSRAAPAPLVPSSAAAAPETSPDAPPPDEGTRAPEASTAGAPAVSPLAAEETASPPPPAKAVDKEPNNPRVLCGPRTQFSLYRCMKEACERSKYYDHPECKYLRVTDAVRELR